MRDDITLNQEPKYSICAPGTVRPISPGIARYYFRWRLLAAVPLSLMAGCAATHVGFLNAAGPVAAGERHLLGIVGLVMLFVIGPVLILTPAFAWRYRLANSHNAFRPTWSFSWVLEFFIWIPPTLIVVGLAFLLWRSARRFDPYTPIPSPVAPLEVQAIALDWKWLFIYPDSEIATVNELAIPAGRAVHIKLTSDTVMQSMLVPQLAGQIYAMPGMTTQLNLAADAPGVYRGQNSQYSGEGFAQDKFSVVSLASADYEVWINRVRTSAHPLTADALTMLLSQSIEPQTLVYSAVPTGLFQQILARTRSSGPHTGDAETPHNGRQ